MYRNVLHVKLKLLSITAMQTLLGVTHLIGFMLPNLHTHISNSAALGAMGCGHDKPKIVI